MKSYYMIMKAPLRGWGKNLWRPHEVFTNKKSANERCKELNEKAKNLNYDVFPVKNGEKS